MFIQNGVQLLFLVVLKGFILLDQLILKYI